MSKRGSCAEGNRLFSLVEGGRQPCYNRLMIEYYQKVADLWPRYGEIDSTIVHQAIVVSLINLEMTSVCLGTYPPEKGYPCWQAMKQIQASPAFERLREKEEGVANLLDLYVARYETDAFAVAVTPKKTFDPALREELIAMTERAYAEKVHPDHWTADMYQVLISQIGCAFERGQMTHYECWKIIHDFYMQTHATMNQEEIDVISYVLSDAPEIFVGYHGLSSVEAVQARRKELLNGHHKFYNGKGGYPADFDNTASPERMMIDLITLCDCLDAATDCYGRNYHQAKTIEQVLSEFERDSGVRYHPDLVRFLRNSPALIQELQTVAGEKRLEIDYQTYQKYFM